MTILSERRARFAQGSARKTLVSRLFLAWSIWRERKSLEELDAHLLKDIGISAPQASQEAKRPLWDAPSRWMQ